LTANAADDAKTSALTANIEPHTTEASRVIHRRQGSARKSGDANIRNCLLGISKRGNKYLRKQLIHGARAALPSIAERDTPLGRWAKELMSRTHRNVAVVALANKLARIAWTVLQYRKPFHAKAVSVAA
jgi:transposase